MNGQFTLSDDSHGVEQVGLNYEKVLDAVRKSGIRQVCFLERGGNGQLEAVSTSTISASALESHLFFSQLSANPGED